MGPKSTSGASALLDLKAELAKKKDELARAKAAGGSGYIVGGVKRPEKKPTLWGRQNKGVKDRSARDVELEAISKPTLENARAALERKAKLYDKLKKGKSGGLSDKQYDSLLVDFDLQSDDDASSSDDDDEEDESRKVPVNPDDDPLVEYEDEFGRMRTARRSEVPRNLPRNDEVPPEDDPYMIRGDQGYFPVYEPTEERVQAINETLVETNPATHYDSTREIRNRGAGFYQFSADEETRREQMDNLKRTRDEAEQARKEDDYDAAAASSSVLSGRGVEKRKRELEERRRALDAKRRKKIGAPSAAVAADDFLATLGKDLDK